MEYGKVQKNTLQISAFVQNPIVREIGCVDFSCLDIMCTDDN